MDVLSRWSNAWESQSLLTSGPVFPIDFFSFFFLTKEKAKHKINSFKSLFLFKLRWGRWENAEEMKEIFFIPPLKWEGDTSDIRSRWLLNADYKSFCIVVNVRFIRCAAASTESTKSFTAALVGEFSILDTCKTKKYTANQWIVAAATTKICQITW